MSTKLDIKNETHWQTRDIGKLVRAALKYSNWQPTKLTIKVDWVKSGNTGGEIGLERSRQRLILNLPKRGPKDDPITMLATAGVSDEPILAPSAVWALARAIAIEFFDTAAMKPRHRQRRKILRKNQHSRARPSWLPKETYIRRYAKKKPAPKKKFMERVEDALNRAETRVEEWEAEIEHAEANLARARRDLKKEQRRMRDARKRAQERGENVEFIGPGHRLYGRI